MTDKYQATAVNLLVQAGYPLVADGKTIDDTAQSIADLFGDIPSGTEVVAFAILPETDAEDGTARGALVWGDDTTQVGYVPEGEVFDGQRCPCHDPYKTFVRKPSGASDVTDVVVVLFCGNVGIVRDDA